MVRGSDPNDNAEDVDIMKGEACSGVASLSNNHGVNLLIRSAAHVTKCWTQPPLPLSTWIVASPNFVSCGTSTYE